MTIRKLERHEAALHRELRLRALFDSPDSFGEHYEPIAALPPVEWERRTSRVSDDDAGAMFVAIVGDTPCGCAYGLIDREHEGGGRVGGMWVDPGYRRSGIGTALLQAVFAWADELGLDPIRLWAPTHEKGAIALYTNAGFHQTGRKQPLPTNECLEIIEMERSRSADGPRDLSSERA